MRDGIYVRDLEIPSWPIVGRWHGPGVLNTLVTRQGEWYPPLTMTYDPDVDGAEEAALETMEAHALRNAGGRRLVAPSPKSETP